MTAYGLLCNIFISNEKNGDLFYTPGMYFTGSMFLVSLSLVMTVCVLNMYFRGLNDGKVPAWMRKVFLQFGRRVLLRQTENKIQPCFKRRASHVRNRVQVYQTEYN
jgi:hypothetical protein